MYLQNLQLEQINEHEVIADLLHEIDKEPVSSESEVEMALANMYQQSADAVSPLYYQDATNFKSFKNVNFSPALAGKNLWEKLRKHLCAILREGSTAEEIITEVLKFIASFIPGGIIIKYLLTKVIKYIMQQGYGALCPVAA